MNLDEYLRLTATVDNAGELAKNFLDAVTDLGFDRCAFLFFPPKNSKEAVPPSFPIFTFPPKYAETFINEKIYEVDYYGAIMRTQNEVFYWPETIYKTDPEKFDRRYAEFIKSVSEGGFYELVTFPVYGSSNAFGEVVLQSTQEGFDPYDRKLTLARTLGNDLMQQYIRIMFAKKQEWLPDLSQQERQVLSWVAKGKSNSVIAEILGLSPHTVDTYIRRCCHKTNTSNRGEAAIRAILSGFIYY